MARKPAQQLDIYECVDGRERVSAMSKPLRLALGNAVASVTPTVAAGACGCEPQQLCDALAGRRRFPTEWAIAIADLVGAELGAAIVAAILEPLGLRAVPRDPVEPDGPYIHRAESALLEFGTPGRTALERIRREARRPPP